MKLCCFGSFLEKLLIVSLSLEISRHLRCGHFFSIVSTFSILQKLNHLQGLNFASQNYTKNS